jgi:excisionase family DNA binding protein
VPEYLTTKEVARYLRLNEKKIYALVAEGKLPAARISGKWLFPKHLVDQWVEQKTLVPPADTLERLLDQMLVIQGSDDWLLGRAIERFNQQAPDGYSVVSSKLGSLAGLRALGRGHAHLASYHVGEAEAREALGGGGTHYGLLLFRREQGLILDRARHPAVRDLADVVEGGLRFAERQPLSGTYHLVLAALSELGLAREQLKRVGPFASHLELALAVRSGRADVGVGIQVVAEQCDLDFVPLAQEPFKLAISTDTMGHPRVVRFFDFLLQNLPRVGSTTGYQLSSRLDILGQDLHQTRRDYEYED